MRLLKFRYFVLAGLLVLLLGWQARGGHWVSDFWEHASVVRELAAHLQAPAHPMLPIDAPHAFFTPYHVGVALLARLLDAHAINALALAGVFNLVLFLAGLYLFVFSLSPTHRHAAPFYSLLLILLFWGTHAWFYSGFFHLRVLGYVLPYPSTFAMGLTLVALWLNQLRLRSGRQEWLLAILAAAVVVLLTHQITFLFLLAGLLGMAIAAGLTWKEVGRLALVVTVVLFLGILWPYYPLLELLAGGTAAFHADNLEMYADLLKRIGLPLLVGIPLLVLELRRRPALPLPWMFFLLAPIYLLGWFFKAYSYGRVISYLVLIAQLQVAFDLARLEGGLRQRFPDRKAVEWLLTGAVLGILVLYAFRPFLRPGVKNALSNDPPAYTPYLFLAQHLQQDDLVLADGEYGLIVPVLGGKVTAYSRPLAFVPDQDERMADVDTFYDKLTSLAERQAILAKYQPDYILLRKTKIPAGLRLTRQVHAFGTPVYEDRHFLLVKRP